MDTEKRLILCFALSMLVVFAFSWLNAKPPRDQQAGDYSSPNQITSSGQSPTRTATPQSSARQPIISDSNQKSTIDQKPIDDSTSSWGWLPSEAPATQAENIIVESSLYRIEFSTLGAIPVSWNLIKFNELFSKTSALKLKATRGSEQQQQLARLELDLMEKHQNNGDYFVDAINGTFPSGNAGFQIRWGKTRSDNNIPYTTSQSHYMVEEKTDISFVYESNGLTLEKVFHFHPDSYHLEMEIRITNNSGKKILFDQDGFYDFIWSGGFGYPSLRTDAKNNVLFQRAGSTTIKPIDSFLSEITNPTIRPLSEYKSSQTQLLYEEKSVGWVGVGQKYFLSAIIPHMPCNNILQGVSSSGEEAQAILQPLMGVRMKLGSLPNGEEFEDKFTLYVGPISDENLAKASASLVDARQIFLRSIIGPIAGLMLRLLQGMYWLIPNYGLAIIALTLLMKILMFPIYQKQIRTTKKMQALQPQITALKEKHKNDAQKLQKEQMELFRKHKVNPLSGCLTMLTTIPVFIALYATFAMAVELRGEPFFGWIQDLSAPDGAFFIPLSSYVIPINILPIAYAILMLWSTSQQAMAGPNATAMKIMPLIFVFFFWSIASGVILYFVISIFIDVTQRLIMDKIKGNEPIPVKTKSGK